MVEWAKLQLSADVSGARNPGLNLRYARPFGHDLFPIWLIGQTIIPNRLQEATEWRDWCDPFGQTILPVTAKPLVKSHNSNDLSFLPSGVHNYTDTQTSAGTRVPYRLSKYRSVSMVLLK
jgi:hypothetical protein